jgi:8-oxo-(d)GTP phosphatase
MAGAAMGDRRTADDVRAAGAVVWRPAGSGSQIVLVHRPKYDDWSFPKGKLEPGEHVLLAAVREVAEETELEVTLGRRLAPVQYDSGEVAKRVDYWVASVGTAPSAFEPNSEVDEVAWLPASRAGTWLSYERDLATLAGFRAGPWQTVPLILLRHASAGSKSDWPKSDMSRPLDSAGTEDALALARLLRCFGAGRVVSAPAERCVATVRPYAASIGGVVEIEAAFHVPGSSQDGRPEVDGVAAEGGAAAAAMARLVADRRPVVICAHRENLPTLLAAAFAALGQHVPPGKPLRKGEFVVLHRAAGKLAAVEQYHPDGDALVAHDLLGHPITERPARPRSVPVAGSVPLSGSGALAARLR